MKSSWPRGAQRPQVLFVIGRGDVPGHTLLGVVALVHRLSAELRVLRVLPRWLPGWSRSRAKLAAAERALRRSLAERMAQVPAHVAVREGDLSLQVAAEVSLRPTTLIVLSPSARHSGERMTELANATGTPVLALRGSSQRKAVLAATDLRQPSLPVLEQAVELCRHLGGALVLFHHVDAQVSSSNPRAATEDVCQAALALAASALPVPCTPVVRTDTSVTRAILSEALAVDAGLIVVGTYQRPWWKRWLLGSVAARVVNRARRSVLVTPLLRPLASTS